MAMVKPVNISLIPIPHLPARSAWALTCAPLSRLKGPRAFRAITSLMLAGALSLWTCLRAGWALGKAARPAYAPVLLLSFTPQ